MPLPQRYNLDLEPIPTPEPSPASWEGFRSLAAQWTLEKPNTLRCHPSVYYTLMGRMPPPWLTYEACVNGPDWIYGISIVKDADLAPGEWKLLRGDEEIDAGTI